MLDKTNEVISILKFLNELGALKNRIVKNINRQPWSLYFDDIPKSSPEIQLNFRDRVNEEEEEDISSVILSVKTLNFHLAQHQILYSQTGLKMIGINLTTIQPV